MIIPCMKLTSATAEVRKGMTAVSGERILLLCPGAPGCTMGAPPGAGVSGWPQAVTALTKSTATEVNQTQSPIALETRSRGQLYLARLGACHRLDSVLNELVLYTCRRPVLIIVL